MDSYSSYRDSARSPRPRDDSRDRTRDDRGDSYYRGRSPGHDRRERRRSRSPVPNIDRYEPRPRRDDRDRDDRRRSPPAIDRYVPGQGSGAPAVLHNPVVDPSKLPYQVGFSYFSEWWRMNEKIKEDKERARTGRRREAERPRGPKEAQEEREREKAKIQAAYDAYKEELQAKMARTFVSEHKGEQWFKERYVAEVRDPFRARLNEMRKGSYAQWEHALEAGVLDDLTLEGLTKNENGVAVTDKEEGETHDVLGVGDLVPTTSADVRDEAQLQPALLIKTIAPHVSRANLESFCREHLGEEEGGFKWLSLSDPNPSKRYHRIGWVMLHPGSDTEMVTDRVDPKDEDRDGDEPIRSPQPSPQPVSTAEKGLQAINGKTVKDEQRGDFVCHVGIHNPPSNPRKKALWDLFSAPERIDRDLELIRRLVNHFEDSFGTDFQAIVKVEERVENMRNEGRLQPPVLPSTKKAAKHEPENDEMLDAEAGAVDEEEEEEGAIEDEDAVDDEELLAKKKQLDMLIEYLRRVFNFCFFCVFESDSVHELTRKCPAGHLRRPRSTLSPTAREVARASALGEPFPEKKRVDKVEEGEIDSPEGERKPRGATSKAEQQLLRAYNWVKTFEDKVMQIIDPASADLRKLGGRPTEEAVEEEMLKHVKQEDEHKFRCKVPECTKLFKEEHFWKKHVEKRHSDWLDGLREEFDLVNAYVLDPAHIAPSRTDANSNGHFPQPNGQGIAGTPRGFNLSNFSMNGMMPNLPLPGANFGQFLAGMQPGGFNGIGDDRSGGPMRRGGMQSNRGQFRSGPYDRRGGRFDPGRRPGGSRWGDGAGAAAGGPQEAVQGRSLKSYEDLDHVAGGGSGELNY